MEQLPKIVRQRLQGTPATDHVDPNLLAAFAENALTERERTLVQAHLAQCAECREITSLAAPFLETERVAVAMAAAPATVAKDSVWGKFNLSWGALAACAVIAVAIFTYQARERGKITQLANRQPEPALSQMQSAQSVENAAPMSAPSQAVDTNLIAKAEPSSPLETRKTTSEKDSAQPGDRYEDKTMARKIAKSPMTASPSVSGQAGALVMQDVKPQVAAGVGSFGTAAETASRADAADELKQLKKEQAQPVPAQSANQAVAVSAPPPPPPSEQKSVASKLVAVPQRNERLGGSFGAISRQKAKVDSASATELQNADLQNKERDRLAANLITPRWNLSSDGAMLLRSMDSGKNWNTVTVPKNFTARAMAALETEVWLGGSSGFLYRSTDQGEHWMLVKPIASGVVLTEDIAKIELLDRQQCEVRTTGGQVWITGDGGQTWQKR